VTVLFFGRLKELAGHAEDRIEFRDPATIEQLFGLYAARHPELAKYRSSVVASPPGIRRSVPATKSRFSRP
jgi:molybdopterin converting factor small subunit